MPITDSTAITQLAAANPFAGLPSAPTNNSLNSGASLLGGSTTTPSISAGITNPVTGTDTALNPIPSVIDNTSFGAGQAPTVGTGGIQSLKDLLDMNKVADPAATAGLTGDLTTIGGKFNELGASLPNADAVKDLCGKVTMPSIPKLDGLANDLASQAAGVLPGVSGTGVNVVSQAGAAAGLNGISGISAQATSVISQNGGIGGMISTATAAVGGAVSNLVQGVKGELSGLMDHLSPTIDSMTGVGNGQFGLPKLSDIMGPVTGQSPAMRAALADPTNPDSIALINDAVNKCNSFFATAGIDLTKPAPNNLKTCMGFATSLHKLGADSGGHGTGTMLANMATDDEAGDAVKASLVEGQNNAALAEAGVAPPLTNEVTDYEKEYKLLNTEWYKYSDQYDLTYSIKTKLDLNNKMIEVQQKMIDLDNQNKDTKQAGIDTAQLASLRRISDMLQGYLDKGNKSMKGSILASFDIPYP